MIEAGDAGMDAEQECRRLINAVTKVWMMNNVTSERPTLGDEGLLKLMKDRLTIE